MSPICLPVTSTIGSWAGVLTAVVFSVSFLGAKQKDFGEAALSTSVHAGIGHQLQVVVGLICAYIFITFFGYDFPLGFGLTPVFGFYGGHGTALSAGTLFQENGWEAGLDVANTMATAGLVCGVVFGVIMINIAARKGKTLYVRQPSQIPREVKSDMWSRKTHLHWLRRHFQRCYRPVRFCTLLVRTDLYARIYGQKPFNRHPPHFIQHSLVCMLSDSQHDRGNPLQKNWV